MMENKMTAYAKKYVNTRIDQIKTLHIPADRRAEKLESITKQVDAFKRGMITEEEMLWAIA